MSRRSRSKRSVRPSGTRAETENPTLAAVEQFDAAVNHAALANSTPIAAPAGHVQQIVPGANYPGVARTAEAFERQRLAKLGVDPALGRQFETATEARAYRSQKQYITMSAAEFDSEMASKASSIRESHVTSDRGVQGGKVEGFNPEAFRRGRKVMAQMGIREEG